MEQGEEEGRHGWRLSKNARNLNRLNGYGVFSRHSTIWAQFRTTNPSAFLTCDLLDIGPSSVQFSPDRTLLSLLLLSLIGSVAVIESAAKVSRGGSPRAAQSLPASRSWRPPTLTVPPRTVVGMRERALLLGGELTIRSARDAGTAVEVRIPRVRSQS